MWKISTAIAAVLLLNVGLVAQKAARQKPGSKATGSNFYLKMSRTECMGRCPAYELTVKPDGSVLFNGEAWTTVKGKANGKLSSTELRKLRKEVENSGFFTLKDSYTSQEDCPLFATDNPTVILSINLNGRKKEITHYLGCREDDPNDRSIRHFPEQLYKLENLIDEIARTERWIGDPTTR